MNTADYEELKTKITDMQTRKSKAEGAIEQILEGWKSYGFKTVEDAKAHVDKLKETITKNQEKINKLWEEIQEILNGVKK